MYPENQTKQIKEITKSRSLQNSRACISVVKVLSEAKAFMSHEQIYLELKVDGIDRATVHENLTNLASSDAFLRHDVGDHVWRFVPVGFLPDKAKKIHSHFMCNVCGDVQCPSHRSVYLERDQPLPKSFKTFKKHMIEIHGKGSCDSYLRNISQGS